MTAGQWVLVGYGFLYLATVGLWAFNLHRNKWGEQ